MGKTERDFRGADDEIRAEYDRVAGRYDARWRKYLASTHRQALLLLEAQPGENVLDVSGGTGVLAKFLRIQFDATVTVVDFSAEMLRAAAARTHHLDDVSLHQADAHALPMEDRTFDKVACLSALHFYRDPNTALEEMHRVLKPGGRLVLIDWCADPFYFKILDALLRLLRRPHVRTYTTDGLQKMLARAGFEIERMINWRSGMWPLVGLRAHRAEAGRREEQ